MFLFLLETIFDFVVSYLPPLFVDVNQLYSAESLGVSFLSFPALCRLLSLHLGLLTSE